MINYYIDDNNTLFIYDDNKIIAEISDCGNMDTNQISNLIDEVTENRGL